MKFSESITISQSPAKIWSYWLQVSTDVQWREGFTKAELTLPVTARFYRVVKYIRQQSSTTILPNCFYIDLYLFP